MTAISLPIHDANHFDATAGPLSGLSMTTVQVNLGLKCNLACRHCHVESGPKRTEAMSLDTMHKVLRVARDVGAQTIDLTGGAPEMQPNFRWFVDECLKITPHVMVRTNLTILLEDGYTDLPEWFAERRIHLVASLPCYLENNVDKQRGRGVYHDSIDVIRKLNAVGYGIEPSLPLDLVFNPGGPSLPPPQASLEGDYKRELSGKFGIRFSHLFTITNVPIGRFLHDITRDGKGDAYMAKLSDAFNRDTLEPLMCRHQIHISHDGSLHDCDFNYAIGLKAATRHIDQFNPQAWVARRVATGNHCFACTAGAGSSCGGALA